MSGEDSARGESRMAFDLRGFVGGALRSSAHLRRLDEGNEAAKQQA